MKEFRAAARGRELNGVKKGKVLSQFAVLKRSPDRKKEAKTQEIKKGGSENLFILQGVIGDAIFITDEEGGHMLLGHRKTDL